MPLYGLINIDVHEGLSIVPQVPNFHRDQVSCDNFSISFQEIDSTVLIDNLAQEIFVVSCWFEL